MSLDADRLFDAEKMWENACDRTTDPALIALYGGMRMAARIRIGMNHPIYAKDWVARVDAALEATVEWSHLWCALQAVRNELLHASQTITYRIPPL